MRSSFLAFLLLLSIVLPLRAETAPSNVLVLTHDALYRGRHVEFSVLIDASVRGLKAYDVRFDATGSPAYLTIPKSCGFFSQLPSVNHLLASATVRGSGAARTPPGGYAFPAAYDHPTFYGYRNPDGLVATEVEFHQWVENPGTLSGPGELYRNGLFVRLDAENGYGWTDAVPRVAFANAVDAAGNPVPLAVGTTPVRYDFRRFGDVDADDRLTVRDATAILRSAIGLNDLGGDTGQWYGDLHPTSPDGKIMSNGRFLGDGRITLDDATTALRVALGDGPAWWPDPR